jgi:hypothetical protein
VTANSNVIPYRENRAKTLRHALDEWREAKELYIERTFALAFELKAARDECGNNDIAFGIWLVENECDDTITKNERSALIKMAEHPEISRQEMERTGNRNVERLWRDHIKPRVDVATYPTSRTDQQIGTIAEIPQKMAPIVPPEQTMIPIPNNTPPAAKASPHRSNALFGKSSAFYGHARGQEVHAIYRNANTRTYIGKVLRSRNGADLWQMILAALDAGFLTETHHSSGSGVISLRILFPDERAASFCRRIDLSTPQARKRVREHILPRMIEHKDAILADPAQIGPIIARAEQAAYAARMATATPVQPRVSSTHECEVVVHGEQFWPNPGLREYSYDQCRAAAWYFFEHDSLFGLIPGAGDARSRAINLRFSVRWFLQWADRELNGERHKVKTVFELVHAMAGAMEQKPQAESKRPPAPTNEREWPGDSSK